MENRLASIDGLRALAVLGVAVFHARFHLEGLGLAHWAKECAHGVDLFFVVSGFCLSYPTLEKLARGATVRFDCTGYALKRFLRIFPPYAVAVAAFAVTAAGLVAAGFVPPEGMHALGPGPVLENLLFIDKPHEYVNNSFWSLGIEFRWYFVLPFALALCARSPRALVTAIVLAALAGELTAASSIDLGCLPAFLLGVLAAHIRVTGSRVTRYALPLGIASALFALANETRPHFPLQTNVGWHLVAFFFVIAAGAWPALRAALGHPALARIGIASYSIYLVHEPIVSAVAVALRPAFGTTLATTGGVLAGVAGGFAFWAIVERPLTRPGFVARFVERGRTRMLQLFTLAGAATSFELHGRPAPVAMSATPLRPVRTAVSIVAVLASCALVAAGSGASAAPQSVPVIDMNATPQPAATKKPGPARAKNKPAAPTALPGAVALIHTALGYVGTRYIMGGTTPAGFDCSGFTQFAYRSIGIAIPRLADQQFYGGKTIAGDPLPGDLVFFQTYQYGPSHVGIYLGNGTFVSAIGKDVHVDSFESGYFRSRYLGARRYLPS